MEGGEEEKTKNKALENLGFYKENWYFCIINTLPKSLIIITNVIHFTEILANLFSISF